MLPWPYGTRPVRPKKAPPMPLPDSIACMAKYCRMDSGMESISSPVSRLFLASNLILARLSAIRQHTQTHNTYIHLGEGGGAYRF